MRLDLTVLDGSLAICRLEPAAAVPEWATASSFFSVTRTPDELSVVCADADVPAGVRAERGWRGVKVTGPLAFDLTGVAAALTAPLARAAIPVVLISTFDTDYVLVKAGVLPKALVALEGAGHAVKSDAPAPAAAALEDAGDAVVSGSTGRGDRIDIVRAGPERIPDLEPLWRSLHEHHMAVARRPAGVEWRSGDDSWERRRRCYERWLNEPGGFVLISEDEGGPVGYAVVHLVDGSQSWATADRIAELETLAMLPRARGLGVGSRLLDAVERELADAGVRHLTVAVAAGNDRALRFYERRGLVVTRHDLLGSVG